MRRKPLIIIGGAVVAAVVIGIGGWRLLSGGPGGTPAGNPDAEMPAAVVPGQSSGTGGGDRVLQAGRLADAAEPVVIQSDDGRVARVVDFNSGESNRDRLALLHRLGDDLSPSDCRILMEHLARGPSDRIEHAIKNDIMNLLREQKTPPAELSGTLIALAEDRDQDPVVRAYALQHLRPWYEQTRDPAVREAILGALEESQTAMAGGALLALNFLARELPEEFDRTLVSTRAAELIRDPKTDILSRISAVQVAAETGNADCLDEMRRWGRDAANLSLQLASISAVGTLGGREDIGWLEELSGDGGPAANAAQKAITKLRDKE